MGDRGDGGRGVALMTMFAGWPTNVEMERCDRRQSTSFDHPLVSLGRRARESQSRDHVDENPRSTIDYLYLRDVQGLSILVARASAAMR